MPKRSPYHKTDKRYHTPFMVVDAETGRMLRAKKFTHSIEALFWAYDNTQDDFKILDKYLNPVPASACTFLPGTSKEYRHRKRNESAS